MEYDFVLDFKVRDYECDIQGIVNNSVYQNYLEHTRHEYLLSRGVDFAEYARENIHLVVTRIELDYKSSLTSGDEFWVGLRVERTSKVRAVFHQDIYRSSDDKLAVSAKVTATMLNARGRPVSLDGLFEQFEQTLASV